MQTYSAASQINIPIPTNFPHLSQEHLPVRGSPRDGDTAETLSAKRGSRNFAVTGGMFSITYEP
jgi:hypothetical protein